MWQIVLDTVLHSGNVEKEARADVYYNLECIYQGPKLLPEQTVLLETIHDPKWSGTFFHDVHFSESSVIRELFADEEVQVEPAVNHSDGTVCQLRDRRTWILNIIPDLPSKATWGIQGAGGGNSCCKLAISSQGIALGRHWAMGWIMIHDSSLTIAILYFIRCVWGKSWIVR